MSGKAKGSAFERSICTSLSLWVTRGKRRDVFWRSAISGGRSTRAFQRGESNRQAGDICSVSSEGHILTDHWHFECKHYREINLPLFILRGAGPLAKFWQQTRRDASRHERSPILIAKQNRMDTIVLVEPYDDPFAESPARPVAYVYGSESAYIYLLDDILKTRLDRWHHENRKASGKRKTVLRGLPRRARLNR